MADISNRDLKEFLKESNSNTKEFIKQTNANITQLNDNLVFHASKSIELNSINNERLHNVVQKLEALNKILSIGGKWILIAFFLFALLAIGKDFIAQKILGIIV